MIGSVMFSHVDEKSDISLETRYLLYHHRNCDLGEWYIPHHRNCDLGEWYIPHHLATVTLVSGIYHTI